MWKFKVELWRKVKAVNTDLEFHQIWKLVGYWSLRERFEKRSWLRPEYTKLKSRCKVSYIVSKIFLTLSYVYFLFLPMIRSSLDRHHDRLSLYASPHSHVAGTNKHLLNWRIMVESSYIRRPLSRQPLKVCLETPEIMDNWSFSLTSANEIQVFSWLKASAYFPWINASKWAEIDLPSSLIHLAGVSHLKSH